MKLWINSALAITLTLMHIGDLFAQQLRIDERRSNSVRRGVGSDNRTGAGTLERAGLKVGQQMPDVTVYDENGTEKSCRTFKHGVEVKG